jgi:Fe2+ transport system protein B
MTGNRIVIPFINNWQLLSVVYLAGAGTPCLVTVITLLREFSIRRTAVIVALQAFVVTLLSASLAWLSRV